MEQNAMIPDGEMIAEAVPMVIETNADVVNRFIRRPDVYRRMMRMYQIAHEHNPQSVSGRVCQDKTGLGAENVCLADRDSTPDNVMCPHGFRNSFKWPFCCVRDGVGENIQGVTVNPTIRGTDENALKRIKRTEFGRMYKRMRPRATASWIDRKYKAYLKIFQHLR